MRLSESSGYITISSCLCLTESSHVMNTQKIFPMMMNYHHRYVLCGMSCTNWNLMNWKSCARFTRQRPTLAATMSSESE